MSWSITLIGTSENIAKALDERSPKLDAQSKLEFDDALPHMKALLLQNFGHTLPKIMKLSAGGSGYVADGVQRQRSFYVNIEQVNGEHV